MVQANHKCKRTWAGEADYLSRFTMPDVGRTINKRTNETNELLEILRNREYCVYLCDGLGELLGDVGRLCPCGCIINCVPYCARCRTIKANNYANNYANNQLLACESAQRAHGRSVYLALWRERVEQLPKDVRLSQTRTTAK